MQGVRLRSWCTLNTDREPLNIERLRNSCADRTEVGRRIEIFEEIDSTNDYCHQQALALPDEDSLAVFAEHQIGGRGQHGRRWSAPPRSAILMSLLLRPPPNLDQARFLTAWSAVCVAEVLRDCYQLPVQIKWPNDVLIARKKICGILVERRKATVVGIGLNIAIEESEFPADLRVPATSLSQHLTENVDRTELAIRLLNRLDEWLSCTKQRAAASLYECWQQFRWPQLGEPVRATTHTEEVTGALLELRPDLGAQILEKETTRIHFIPPEHLLRVERCPTTK